MCMCFYLVSLSLSNDCNDILISTISSAGVQKKYQHCQVYSLQWILILISLSTARSDKAIFRQFNIVHCKSSASQQVMRARVTSNHYLNFLLIHIIRKIQVQGLIKRIKHTLNIKMVKSLLGCPD